MSGSYIIYGCGVTGLHCADYLKKHDIDFKLLINDTEVSKQEISPFLNNVITKDEFYKLSNYNFIIVRSPGIPHFDEVIKYCYSHNIAVISEIELAYSFNQLGKYIFISGSNGKTTVASLLYTILKKAYKDVILVGNIGDPLIDYIDEITSQTYIVLEISSFQLENTYTPRPLIGVLTNLTPNHLNHVISLDYYYESKLKLVELVDEDGVFIKNIDDEIINSRVETYKKCVNVSLLNLNAEYYYDQDTITINKERTVKLDHPNLIGVHNKYNVLLAFAIVDYLEIDYQTIMDAVNEFKGVEFRLQRLGMSKKINIYNDAKSTTPESTLVALNALSNKKVHLLLGGESKHLSYKSLIKDNVVYYSYGKAKEEIKNEIPDAKLYKNIKTAYLAAINEAKAGEVILLSPACASFDQFKNYIERGKYFTSLVKDVGLDDE